MRVAVFGDLIVDEFIYGEIARVSREAPVLILNYDSTEIVPGGAGNAAGNVAALGGAAVAIGVDRAATKPAAGCSTRCGRTSTCARCVRAAGFRTPTKTRILAGGIHSAKQQVVRIDRGARPRPSTSGDRATRSRARLLNAAARATRCSCPTTAAGW